MVCGGDLARAVIGLKSEIGLLLSLACVSLHGKVVIVHNDGVVDFYRRPRTCVGAAVICAHDIVWCHSSHMARGHVPPGLYLLALGSGHMRHLWTRTGPKQAELPLRPGVGLSYEVLRRRNAAVRP